MDACLCNRLCQTPGDDLDRSQAKDLIPALNDHLRRLQLLLAQIKGFGLSRDVRYTVTSSKQRTSKALSVASLNLEPVDRICDTFGDDMDGFWRQLEEDDNIHKDLRRRISCVIIFLRSKLDASASVPLPVAAAFQGPRNYSELRHAGRKYLKISEKLGGLGCLFWLPVDIPYSTYERYLNQDDQDTFNHLSLLNPKVGRYSEIVRRLVVHQVQDGMSPYTYYNLGREHGDLLSLSDHMSTLLHALGGNNIPHVLLKSALSPQKRWGVDGEMASTGGAALGLPKGILNVLSSQSQLDQALTAPHIVRETLHDGTITWSIRPEVIKSLAEGLSTEIITEFGLMALKVICLACPPCYLGDTEWPTASKEAIWPLLNRAVETYKIPQTLKIQILEATLYFCERDDVALRYLAVERSRSLLSKSMPYYLHASVVLFHSILCRNDGDVIRSEALIRDFLCRGPKPETRRDHAIYGRLHISQVDNKIKCWTGDVPVLIYNWRAEQPLSSLDVEVTSRLQGTAARFFQSIGDFTAASASMEQFLSLGGAKPIRANTRRLFAGRLADIYCEMNDFVRSVKILDPELRGVPDAERQRRPFRRLALAMVEVKIAIGQLDVARSILGELDHLVPREPDNVHDQQLHMRRIIAEARIAHLTTTSTDSSRETADVQKLWLGVLEEVAKMHTLKGKDGFCAAVIYLSLAHYQLLYGSDVDGARCSWDAAAEILKTEQCEYWIPIVSTSWIYKVATEVHQRQGWPLRMMRPDGKSDMTWPASS